MRVRALVLIAVIAAVILVDRAVERRVLAAGGAPGAAIENVEPGGLQPLRMPSGDFDLLWGITRTQEQACGGGEIAGGASEGVGNVTHLGRASIAVSAAWDIGRLIGTPQFKPVGPAGGPVATVLGRAEYPYNFLADPYGLQCRSTVAATGRVLLTAANGDQVKGEIVGGETHRLDFLLPGDGVETFAIVEIVGGSGRFANARGSFVSHTVTRFFSSAGLFRVLLAEMLPGGTITY